MKNKKLEVTIMDAFRQGKLEGKKEAFREVLEVLEASPEYVKYYILARLKAFEDLLY